MVMSPRSGSESAMVMGILFALFVDPEDHELAGLALPGDPGGLDPEELDVGGEETGFVDEIHGAPLKQEAGQVPLSGGW